MTETDDLHGVPPVLPVPADDGACDHLPGMPIPSVALRSSADRWVVLAELRSRTIVYCYPRTGEPNRDLPSGWDLIPGARGCTPQTCAFRDHHAEIRDLGAEVFGMSTQTSDYQREMVERLHVPFEILSDADLTMVRALRLPTFVVEDMTLVRRLTLIVSEGVIEHVMYPVFPPDGNAEEVIRWLRAR